MKAARLDEQLCFALYSASSRLTAIYRPILEPLDLTYTQFVVMMALWEVDGVSITQLARTTGISKATLTPLLRKLTTKQLTHLERVEGNDRQKRITLTRRGRALAAKSDNAVSEAFCATGLTVKQAQTLIDLCHRIAA